MSRLRFIRREPLGVVLVLAPWNYPWLSSVNAIVPALLAGNAVVLKSSSQTPLVSDRYAEEAKGLPLFTVDTDHDGVAAMIGNERVGFVAFTGSVAGGHAVQRAAADRFTNLELGGKDPAYVRPDADLDKTIPGSGRRRLLQRRAVVLCCRARLRPPQRLRRGGGRTHRGGPRPAPQ